MMPGEGSIMVTMGQGTRALLLALLIGVGGCAYNPFVRNYQEFTREQGIGPELPIDPGDRVIVYAHRGEYVETELRVETTDASGISGTPVTQPDATVRYEWDDIYRLELAETSENKVAVWTLLIIGGIIVIDQTTDLFEDALFGDDDD